MEIKFFKFFILAILAGVFLPNIQNFCRASENSGCHQKFVDDPMYRPFDTMLKLLFEVIESVRSDVSSLNIPKHKCISYSLTQKAVDGMSGALDMIIKKNCSALNEIEKFEEDAVSAAVSSVINIYVPIRNLCGPYAEFEINVNEIEKNAINYASTAFRCVFNEIKITLSEICPDNNKLVKVENNALELLKADNDQAVSKVINFMDETINLSKDIHASYIRLHQSNAKDDFSRFDANRRKSDAEFSEVFQSFYEILKNYLPKSKKET